MTTRVTASAAAVVIASLFLVAYVPHPAWAVTFGNFGSRVTTLSSDFNPTYSTRSAPTICSRDISDGASVLDDQYYLNMDGAGTTVALFDVRLTTSGSLNKGTFVATGESDVGLTLSGLACTAFATNVRVLEGDGLPGWSENDLLYWSQDATVGAGDVRLAVASASSRDSQSLTVGTIVQSASEADAANVANNNGKYPDCTTGPPTASTCTSSAILTNNGDFTVEWFDANLNGAVDAGDHVLLAKSRASTSAPDSYNINDIYLVGGTFGSRVLRGSSDYLVEPATFGTPPELAYARILGTDSNCDRLWVHFFEYAGTSDVVLVDDVVLYMPSSGLTTCPAQPASSSVTPGTRVTDAANHLQGTGLQATSTLSSLIFYVDQNSNSVFDSGDPVYVNRPTTFGGASGTTVTAGDYRVTSVTVGSTTFAAGTIVGSSDGDISSYSGSGINNEASKQWFVRRLNADGATEIPLQSASTIKYKDDGTASRWDPSTDEVYIDADGSGTVTVGDIRLHAGDAGLPAGPTTSVTTGQADISGTLTSSSDFRVTGGDATFDDGREEAVYFSVDPYVNDEDYVVQKASGNSLTLGQVAAACAANACLNEGVHTNDVLYFSWCATTGGCPGRLLLTDVQVSPTMGQRTTASGADFVPSLRALPTAGGTLIRYNRGDGSSVIDDVFIASTDGSTITTQDVRWTSLAATKAAGTLVTSADNEELTASSAGGSGTTSGFNAGTAGGLADLLKARDVDGISGFSLADNVYLDVPSSGGLGGGTTGALSAFDVRVSEVTGFTPGSFVLAGHSDLQGGTTFLATVFCLGMFDENLNGVFDSPDVLYAVVQVTSCSSTLGGNPQPPLGAIRVYGAGGALGSGDVAPPPPPAVVLPSLGSAAVSPTCVAPGGSVTATVVYTDSQNRAPSARNFVLGSTTVAMTTAATSYTSGATYTAAFNAPTTSGSQSGSFSFANAGGSVSVAAPAFVVMSAGAAAPTLASGAVSPAAGADGATFTWSVVYTDTNNDAPTVKEVVIDGVANVMSSSDSTLCDGATYTFSQAMAAGDHSYHFRFKDAASEVRLPTAGSQVGPTVTAAPTSPPPPETTPPETTTTTSPGGTPGFEAALLAAAVLAVAWAYRRRD